MLSKMVVTNKYDSCYSSPLPVNGRGRRQEQSQRHGSVDAAPMLTITEREGSSWWTQLEQPWSYVGRIYTAVAPYFVYSCGGGCPFRSPAAWRQGVEEGQVKELLSDFNNALFTFVSSHF